MNFYEPEGTNTAIHILKGDSIIFHCSSGFDISQIHRLHGECVGHNQYKIKELSPPENIYSFVQMTCLDLPKHEAREVGTCYLSKTAVDIGFPLDDGTFLPVMHICHDKKKQQSLYARYMLKPMNYLFQIDSLRPKFIKGGFFGNIPINALYSKGAQTETFRQLLGKDEANKLIKTGTKDTHYFSRGHLMEKVGMIFGILQRATFYFLNAAAQWQCINAGNWELTEATLRAFVALQGIIVSVITGTYGILQIPDCNNHMVDIYLNVGGNHTQTNSCYTPEMPIVQDRGYRTAPVPLIFYKAVIDLARMLAVVFLSVNNPYLTDDDIESKDITICNDVSSKIDWMKWQLGENYKRGYIYACTMEDFTKKIRHLPPDIAKHNYGLLVATPAGTPIN